MENPTLQSEVGAKVVDEWLPLIHRALNHYQVRPNDKEDVAQSIVCQIFEKRYDRIYDPEKSELSTFIFGMVRKRILSLRGQKGRDAMKHVHLVGDDEWIINDRRKIESSYKRAVRGEFFELVEDARKELEKLPRRRPRIKDGKLEHRTVTDVFDMLVGGMVQTNIAKEMGYSEGTVSIMVEMIRQQPAVQKLLVYYNM